VLIAAVGPVLFFVTGLVTVLAHGTGNDENTQTLVLAAIGCSVYGAGSLARQTRGPGWFDASIGTGLGVAGVVLVTALVAPRHELVLLIWKLVGLLLPVAVAAVVGGLWPAIITATVGLFCIEYYLLGTYREFAIGARGILYALLAVAVACALARRWTLPSLSDSPEPDRRGHGQGGEAHASGASAAVPVPLDRLRLPYRTRLRWGAAFAGAGLVLVILGMILGIVSGAVGEVAGTTVGWILGGAAVAVTTYAMAWAFDAALFEGRLIIDADNIVVRDGRGRSVTLAREDVVGFAARDSGRGELSVHVLHQPTPGIPDAGQPLSSVELSGAPRSLVRGNPDQAATIAAALLNRTWFIDNPPSDDGAIVHPDPADLPVRFEKDGSAVELHDSGLIVGRRSTTWWLPWQSVVRIADSSLRLGEDSICWALGVQVQDGPLLGVLGLPTSRAEKRAALAVIAGAAAQAGVPCTVTGLRRGAGQAVRLDSRTLRNNQVSSPHA
jgi:hypothetical protein